MSNMKLKMNFFMNMGNNLTPSCVLFCHLRLFSYPVLAEFILFIADSTFTAAGDWGCTSNTDATVTNMVNKNPVRVFGLGDYSYQSTGSCFFNKSKFHR